MSRMSKNRDLSRESRSFGYEKHEKTKKNDFFFELRTAAEPNTEIWSWISVDEAIYPLK